MNIRFLLKIPFRNKTKLPDGTVQEEEKKASLVVDTLLDPYYISDSALLSMFVDESEYGRWGLKAREIAFHASLRAWEWAHFKLCDYPEEQRIYWIRELAMCFAINAFAKHFYQNHYESLHRSKTYAEFTVTTTVRHSPHALKGILDDSQRCIDEMKKEIEEAKDLANGVGLSNYKGSLNCSNPWTWRLWFNNNLSERSEEIYASEKYWYNGNIYKDGKHVSNTRAYYQGRATRSPVYHY